MLKRLSPALAIAIAGATLALPGASMANVVPVPSQEAVTAHEGGPVETSLAEMGYLGEAVRKSALAASFATPDATSWFSATLSAPQKLRASSDLALWHLVATVHAQQKHKYFDLVDNHAKTVLEIEHDRVSAVPLPGVVWLFVMGLMGLVGTRVKTVRTPRRAPETQVVRPTVGFGWQALPA